MSSARSISLKIPCCESRSKRNRLNQGCSGTGEHHPDKTSFIVHLNRLIKEHDANIIYIAGPGHGGPSLNAMSYLEGTYTEVHPEITPDENGLRLHVQEVFDARRRAQATADRTSRIPCMRAANLATRWFTPSAPLSTIRI